MRDLGIARDRSIDRLSATCLPFCRVCRVLSYWPSQIRCRNLLMVAWLQFVMCKVVEAATEACVASAAQNCFTQFPSRCTCMPSFSPSCCPCVVGGRKTSCQLHVHAGLHVQASRCTLLPKQQTMITTIFERSMLCTCRAGVRRACAECTHSDADRPGTDCCSGCESRAPMRGWKGGILLHQDPATEGRPRAG